MNFKLNFSSSLLGGSDQASEESFETRRDNVLRKHSAELTPTQRVATIMLMSELNQLDTLLHDQELADKVLLANTRHTFKYFKAGYDSTDTDPGVTQAFRLHESIMNVAGQVVTKQQRAVAHALHTFGYKLVPADSGEGTVIVGRNFRIIFG